MALPLPDAPAGCVKVTFQANIEGFPETSRTLSPRIVTKLLSYMSTAYRVDSNGSVVQGFPGLTEMFEYILDQHLLRPVEISYPDVIPQEVLDLEALLLEARNRTLPKFI